ncbi:MAG: heparin lyase I family protein [Paracoccaceae bacterium]
MKNVIQAFVSSMLFAGFADADTYRDDFSSGEIDASQWCECQIDPEYPVRSGNTSVGAAGTVLIDVDSRDVGGNNCRFTPVSECVQPGIAVLATDGDEDDADDLTASIFAEFTRSRSDGILKKVLRPNGTTYCSDLVQDAANKAYDAEEAIKGQPIPKLCIQRQELRLFSGLRASATRTSSYIMKFRMPEKDEIQDRVNSMRWVLAQWKHTKLSANYENAPYTFNGQSPFVAVRFDDAVLHVTVQDEFWRCLVAAAKHDIWPDMETINGRIPDRYCFWTGPDDYFGPKPKHSLTLIHHTSPVLENATGQYTTLRIDIEAGPSGQVVLWQDDTKVATVIGRLGYNMDQGWKSKIKFKFGQYRDYLPDNHSMEIDFVEIKD